MKLLDEQRAAEMLTVTKAALRRWRRERRGPAFVRIGRLLRYEQTDLEIFVRQNRHDRGLQKKVQLTVVSP